MTRTCQDRRDGLSDHLPDRPTPARPAPARADARREGRGDRRAPPPVGRAPSPGGAATVLPGGPGVARHARTAARPGAVGILSRYAGDAAALAPRARRPVLDLPWAWSRRAQRPGRRGGHPGTSPGPGEPALGLPPHRGGVPQAQRGRLGDQRGQRAPPSPPSAGTP